MKINRDSWHYRLRAWALRGLGCEMLIETKYSNTGIGEYIFDVVVVGAVAILVTPLRWLVGLYAIKSIEFYNDKEER